MKTIMSTNNWLSELDEIFGRENKTLNYNFPATNIIESNENYKLNLVAPGFEKSDFKIETEKDLLQIAVE